MWWIRADGTGQPQLLTRSNNQQFPDSFTADGKRLAFLGNNSGKRGGRRLTHISGA
jgi:hypothetical protein